MSEMARHFVDSADRDCYIGALPSGRVGIWISVPGYRFVVHDDDIEPVHKHVLDGSLDFLKPMFEDSDAIQRDDSN